MGPATQNRRQRHLSAVLAGLQAGTAAVFVMLGWLGFSSALERRSFWAAENLMSSALSGHSAIPSGFAFSTVSGLSLYLALYGLLGALFALLVGRNLHQIRLLSLGAFFGLFWYYISFRLIWKNVSPLVTLLHDEHPTLLANLIYGMLLARFPSYLRREEVAVPGHLSPTTPLISGAEMVESNGIPEGNDEGAIPEETSTPIPLLSDRQTEGTGIIGEHGNPE